MNEISFRESNPALPLKIFGTSNFSQLEHLLMKQKKNEEILEQLGV
jgi:hypothetical protein